MGPVRACRLAIVHRQSRAHHLRYRLRLACHRQKGRIDLVEHHPSRPHSVREAGGRWFRE